MVPSKQQFDLLSVVRAAKALAGEAVPDNLLGQLVRIAIEQAGAQKAYVILLHENELVVEAGAVRDTHGDVTVKLMRGVPAASLPSLPGAIINHVWRSKRKVVLANATASPEFSRDLYIMQARPGPVLCQPIFRRTEMIGLLYLESNVASGEFSEEVADVLSLFTSEAALSLEVARLSSDLKEEHAERHRAERDLQNSEAHYRRLFEVPKDGILMLDFETGRITSVNSFLTQMLGFGYTELLGKRLWEIGPFRNLAGYRLLFSDLQDNSAIRYEYLPVQTKDGHTIDVEFASSVYELDNNKVIQCSMRAVTDRRRAEQRQAVQFVVTRVLAEATSITEAAAQLLKVICENFGWEVGEIWRVDSSANLLRPLRAWRIPALGSPEVPPPDRHTAFSPGCGLPGRVWQTGEAEWMPDIMGDPPCDRTPFAAQIGLHGGLAVPIKAGAKVRHVMAFYTSQTRWADQEMMNAMTMIGSQIGQFIERKQTERALVESEERFRLLTHLSTDWYWEQDRDLRYTLVSEGLLHLQSFLPGDFLGKTREELAIDVESLGRAQWEAHQAQIKARQPFYNLEYKIYDSKGRAHWFSINGAPLFGPGGAFNGYRGTGKDITARKQAEELTVGQGKILEMIATGADLKTVLEQLVSVIAQQSDGMIGSVVLLDEDGMHVRSSIAPGLPDSFTRSLGGVAVGPRAGSCGAAMYRCERVITTDIARDPLWTDYRDLALAHGLHACISTPILSQRGKALGAFAMYYGAARVPTETELGLADIASHIAGIAIERKQAEERIRHMAHHDELTGLPNRTLLGEHVELAIAQAERTRSKTALLFVDLDHFKHVNDSLGHQAGDRLLRSVARRLQNCMRKSDSLARLGGDEFVLILPGLKAEQDAAPIAQKLLDTLHQPFAVDGQELHVSGSIGISLYPTDGTDAEALMRAADIAMYHAKEKGRGNFQYFTFSLNQAVQHRLRLASQLRHALARGELTMHYQPQIDMETGRIFAAEALIRWHQSDHGYIPPAEFIPIAEETGLIFPVGEWVLQTACAQLRRWRDAGFRDMKIAVNLSARQVVQHGFVDTVARVLYETGLPATALDLEITESLLMQPSEENLTPLNRLSEMGIQLSVDDFGTGYSSLSYLKRFPINTLKIDQSFVRGIDRDHDDMTIVAAIIAMAQSLRLKVIAEGVETAAQGSFLREHGCLLAQGYYYSKPMPADMLSEVLCKEAGIQRDRGVAPCLRLVPRAED
jgi:diguanylate cyclase (GGDEF)-like protein/PAS domain S-box-containing protein